ncbi:hypothetical protein RA086_09700 [Lactiplantibacillus sp. WILCCON 0030]|uniref:Uncharacterized protein n=1 Tax=Lactiplantibacillus brownii TaxID=3069269 RepID=A0ABU1AC29_9LACO|nr:hypothetical protein [Lactiplantibacillus brownii]MDQ7937880.1 hypothetical protein [Lactiplantibacillus brownii]
MKELTRRQQLADLGTEKRYTFTGNFERYGYRHGYQYDEPTILLKDIRLKGKQLVMTHLWFNLSKAFSDLGELKRGDQLQFSGRIAPYIQDYQGHREDAFSETSVDYQIAYPSKVRLLRPASRRSRAVLPTDLTALVAQINQWNSQETNGN